MLDPVLFIAFPYLAIVLAVGMGLYRYFRDRYSYSSFSSQVLENRLLFWGSIPWHYGIVLILLAHVLGLLFPGLWAALLGEPNRLYVLEVTGLALALFAIVGLIGLVVRRLVRSRPFAVTSPMDWAQVVLLLAQVVLGFSVAFFYRWGAMWYLYTAVPWLSSLATFSPLTQPVAVLPLVIKLHMLNGLLWSCCSPSRGWCTS